jgi:hypothetical protein
MFIPILPSNNGSKFSLYPFQILGMVQIILDAKDFGYVSVWWKPVKIYLV